MSWLRAERDLKNLKEEFDAIAAVMIDQHKLGPEQQEFIRRRWQVQTRFIKGRVILNPRSVYLLRWPAVLGAVVAPTLVGVGIGHGSTALRWATFVVPPMVTVATAWGGGFRYGRRWRPYRQSLDAMRAEGWAFGERIGEYQDTPPGDESFRKFGSAVDLILRSQARNTSTECSSGTRGWSRESMRCWVVSDRRWPLAGTVPREMRRRRSNTQ